MPDYPKVKNPDLVGEYPGLVHAGGGYVWDDVLEYRVWCRHTDRKKTKCIFHQLRLFC